jgi:hypothetical protein
MRKIDVLAIFATILLSTTLMTAQATRTWVSGVGDDANPCSRTAPCKTFAGAISKTAPGGEIDALDPGGFGALTITKAITLDGGGGQVASVLVSGTNGIVVAAGVNDVVIIRNLRLDGLLGGNSTPGINGISWISGKALQVENCVIFGFNQNGINIAKSDGGRASISGTTAANNAVAGLLVKNTTTNVQVAVTNSVFTNNAFGIAAQDFSKVSVSRSEISVNSNAGLQSQAVTGGTALLDVYDSTVAHNPIGLQAGGSGLTSTANITQLALFDNAASIVAGAGGTINTFHTSYNTGTGSPNGAFTTPQ